VPPYLKEKRKGGGTMEERRRKRRDRKGGLIWGSSEGILVLGWLCR
jgi:hypothetical protein